MGAQAPESGRQKWGEGVKGWREYEFKLMLSELSPLEQSATWVHILRRWLARKQAAKSAHVLVSPDQSLPRNFPQVGPLSYALIIVLMGFADLLLIALREAGLMNLSALLAAMVVSALLAMAGSVGVAVHAWRAAEQLRHWREEIWQHPRQWSVE